MNTVAAPDDRFMSDKNANALVKAIAVIGRPLDVQWAKKRGAWPRRARP